MYGFDKVWHMFKGRWLSNDEMCYDRVLSQLVKLAFDMSYVKIHENTKIVYFVDFFSVTFASEYQS